MKNNVYIGLRDKDGTAVEVNGIPLDLRLDLGNHSPTGFEWGYSGSGPTQLAIAMLAHEFSDNFAKNHYFEFRDTFIATIESDDWSLDSRTIYDWAIKFG